MPTKDHGKPASPKRGGANQDANTTSQPRNRRTRVASGGEEPTPAPTAVPKPSVTTPRAARRRAQRQVAVSATAAAQEQHEGQPPPDAAAVAIEQTGENQASPEEPSPAGTGAAHETTRGAGELGPEEAEPAAEEAALGDAAPRRRDRRGAGTNALGVFIERQFANTSSPCHSYSDLERHSGISREALSRYVTARTDRRRSPTIDTLVAIADALHISLEAVARAAGASVKGVIPPPEDMQHAREEALGALVAALSDEQFSAVVELLRQMRPPAG